MLGLTMKAALSPLLVAQAMLARWRIPRLPEPPGARQGDAGQGAALRLLVLGDSSAAGVGVAHQQQALAWPLARALAERCERRVSWQLLAASGLTTAQLGERVAREVVGAWDLAVVISGVNDVVEQVPSQRAVARREALVNRLRNAHGVRHVVFAPLPPIGRFVGLPQPLRAMAGLDARRHNHALQAWVGTRADVSCVALNLSLDKASLASDGFHPGPTAYRHISKAFADHLAAIARESGPCHP